VAPTLFHADALMHVSPKYERDQGGNSEALAAVTSFPKTSAPVVPRGLRLGSGFHQKKHAKHPFSRKTKPAPSKFSTCKTGCLDFMDAPVRQGRTSQFNNHR